MKALLERYQQLSEREQRLLWVASVVFVALVFYFALWQPLNRSIELSERAIDSRQELLQFVSSSAAKAKQLQQGHSAASRFTGSLPQAVNRAASRHQIQIARMQPQGDELQVWVDAATFNNTLEWLQQLEQSGIQILDLDLAETDASGMIRIRRLRLGKA